MDVTCYVVLEPRTRWGARLSRSDTVPGSAVVVRCSQSQPSIKSGQVAVKVRLTVDPAIFMSPAYEVSGVVDADLAKSVELAVADLAAARFASESTDANGGSDT